MNVGGGGGGGGGGVRGGGGGGGGGGNITNRYNMQILRWKMKVQHHGGRGLHKAYSSPEATPTTDIIPYPPHNKFSRVNFTLYSD